MIVIYVMGAASIGIMAYIAYYMARGYIRAWRLQEEVMQMCLEYDYRHEDLIDENGQESAFIWFGRKLPAPRHLAQLDHKLELKHFYTPEDLERIKS